MPTTKNPKDANAQVPNTDRPQEMRKQNQGFVQPSPSAPPDQPAPTPGADIDSADGIQSGRGRDTGLTDEVTPPKDTNAPANGNGQYTGMPKK